MEKVVLGELGLTVSRMGLGCLWMARDQSDETRAGGLNTLRAALECQVSFWDTADIYGTGSNERFLSETLKTERSRVQLATKCGIVGAGPRGPVVCGRPDYIQNACRDSLKRLGTDYIDLLYLHAIDPDVPVEESIGSMGELVSQGLVRYIGLRSKGLPLVVRAHRESPLSAVQADYNLLDRSVENELLPGLVELKIGFVASSPLERGLLTGGIDLSTSFSEFDPRNSLPRFSEEHRPKNLRLLSHLRACAERRGLDLTQIAVAWMGKHPQELAFIPGTLNPEHVEQNVAAMKLDLTPEERKLAEMMAGKLSGAAYPRWNG